MKRLVLLLLSLATAAPAQDTGYREFMDNLSKALEFKDEKLLDRTVRTATHQALQHFYALVQDWNAQLVSRREDAPAKAEQLRGVLDTMLASWRRVFDTETLERVERYYSYLGPEELNSLAKLDQALTKAYGDFARAQEKRARTHMEHVRDDLMKIADLFLQMGHTLKAAECWALMGQVSNALPDPTLQERKDAIYAMERFKELRESWSYTQDLHYQNNIAWLKSVKDALAFETGEAQRRVEAGIAAEARGPEALVDPKAPEEVADLEFQVMKQPIADCFIRGGSVAPAWMSVLIEDQKPAQLAFFQASAVFAVQPGVSKFGVSQVGDASWEDGHFTEVNASTRPKASVFFLDEEKHRPYAMWFFAGGKEENYMGVKLNLEPTKQRTILFYKSASSWEATLNGEPVVLYDSNGNGQLFETDPYAFGLRERSLKVGEDIPVAAYDSMRIGKRGTIQPFSAFARIGDKWFHLRPQREGTAIGARPLHPDFFKTGTVQMKWGGPRQSQPEVLIIRGRGDYSVASYNIADGRPMEVPAAEYDIAYGRLVQGKGGQLKSANIFKGASEAITVKPGETTVVKLGAPFRLEFEKEISGANVKIDSFTFRVVGAGGEHYQQINGAVPECEVVVARRENGAGAKPVGEFVAIVDPQQHNEIASALSFWEVPYFPVVKGAKGDYTVLSFIPPFEGFVGLKVEKNKLFGRIESEFK